MRYKIQISNNDDVFFTVEIDSIDKKKNEKALTTVLERFPVEEGFDRYVFFSDSETRYLKSTDDSIEVLASVPIYQSPEKR